MLTAYDILTNKVRLYPSKTQSREMLNTVGARRWVYNYFLDLENKTYAAYVLWQAKPKNRRARKEPPRRLGFSACSKILTRLRNNKETAWLSETSAQAQQQALRDLDTAFSRFLSSKAKHPVFKKRGSRDSFRVQQNCDLVTPDSQVRVGKIGWVRCRGMRTELEDRLTVQSVTVTKEAGNWYASILCRVPAKAVTEHVHGNRACGIDVGVAVPYAVATSTGRDLCIGTDYSKALVLKEARRKRYQRTMRRKFEAWRKAKATNPEIRLGANYKKTGLKVARAYKAEADFRKDFQHKLSTKLAKTYGVICVEDLHIKGMTKSACGTTKKPGKSVRAKSGLNREMLRLGHAGFVTMLEYKAKKFGGVLIRVNPKNTSRQCPNCDNVGKSNRKSQAIFKCQCCGYTANADTNAAFNIMRLGIAA